MTRGGLSSTMVTLKEQVTVELEVPSAEAEQLTVVVPIENNDPEGGAQLTVAHPLEGVGE